MPAALAVLASILLLSACSSESGSASSEDQGSHLLRWDFSGTEQIDYLFEQRSESISHMAMMLPQQGPYADSSHYLTMAEGQLSFVPSAENKATLRLSGDEIKAYELDMLNGRVLDSLTEPFEPLEMLNIKEDGKQEVPDELGQQLFDYLFALPQENLEPGKYEDKSVSLPLATAHGQLQVTGNSRLTFTGIEQHQNRRCARLDLHLLIDQIQNDGSAKGEYMFLREGNSTFYFDLDEREFVSGEVTINSTIYIDEGLEAGIVRIENSDQFSLQIR